MISNSDTPLFDELSRPDKWDCRLESERHSEEASRAACRRARIAPLTPEQQRQCDLDNQEYYAKCRLDALYLARREPRQGAVVLERSDGRRLQLFDRMRTCWSRTPNGGTRLTLDEATALQADFPLYLADTTIRSLTHDEPSLAVPSPISPVRQLRGQDSEPGRQTDTLRDGPDGDEPAGRSARPRKLVG